MSNLFLKYYFSSSSEKRIFFEALFLSAWFRVLTLLPFRLIKPSLGKHNVEAILVENSIDFDTISAISRAVKRCNKYTPWDTRCLVQALVAKRMLNKRNIQITLYIGVSKDENEKLIAHAWTRYGEQIITGKNGYERFVVVSMFS